MKVRNRRILSLFLSFALVIGVMLGAAPKAFAEEAKTLTIVHVNDVHGRINDEERDGVIGYAKLKTKVDELKEANPNLLLLNAGDTIHGTVDINITRGETMIGLMNKLGFDAMTPGNHDFNYGYERLMELKEMAEFPLLGANIVKEVDDSSDFEPYIIKELDGIKVGIFGLGTDETKYKSHPDNTKGIKFADPVETAKKMVEKLQGEKVDVIIALVHLGIDDESEITAITVAENVEGIDVIVDGHSHSNLDEGKLVEETLIVQADSWLKNIGIVDIEIVDGKVSSKKASLFTYEDAKALTPDAEILEEIKKIEEINKPIKEIVVGKSNVELVGEREVVRTGESNLGNMLTDAMIKATDADIALTNGGGIRASIPAGDITAGHVLTTLPFTNFITVIEVKGDTIIKALERGVDGYPDAAGHFPHISGMTFTLDAGKPVGSRVSDLLINNEPVDLEKTYKLVTNDFVAGGGDGYTMFEGLPVLAEGALLSDALMDYIKEVGEVAPEVEGRITVIPAPEVEDTPVEEPILEPVEEPVAAIQSYVVKSGDVLWKIAKMFNTTWEKLAEYNNLKNPHLIFPNQVILVP